MRLFLSRVFALVCFNLMLGFILSAACGPNGCDAFNHASSVIAQGAIACSPQEIAIGEGVKDAIHDGGQHFETITQAIVDGVLGAECLGKYIRDHWHDHDCADASSTCMAGAIPADEQRRAELLMKVAAKANGFKDASK